jgi:hypothetical protein
VDEGALKNATLDRALGTIVALAAFGIARSEGLHDACGRAVCALRLIRRRRQ